MTGRSLEERFKRQVPEQRAMARQQRTTSRNTSQTYEHRKLNYNNRAHILNAGCFKFQFGHIFLLSPLSYTSYCMTGNACPRRYISKSRHTEAMKDILVNGIAQKEHILCVLCECATLAACRI